MIQTRDVSFTVWTPPVSPRRIDVNVDEENEPEHELIRE